MTSFSRKGEEHLQDTESTAELLSAISEACLALSHLSAIDKLAFSVSSVHLWQNLGGFG
jgi:hypothetical protein